MHSMQNVYRGHGYPNPQQYHELIDRISSLETSLSHTQQNEAKLIAIIERLERREQVSEMR
jgi:hypothetical protein